MANNPQNYLIAGNDEHGLEPMPTDNSELLSPKKVPIYLDLLFYINS